jgi:hypothetical protein
MRDCQTICDQASILRLLDQRALLDHRDRACAISANQSWIKPQFLVLSTSAPVLIIEIAPARSRKSIVDQASILRLLDQRALP